MITSRWSIDIPTRTARCKGSQLFVVDADTADEARKAALTEAERQPALRHRQGAALDVDPTAITVRNIGPVCT